MKLFVPGRICLFGEHSDWAGSYRRTNSELEKGYTLIAGTNQGIYADVKQHPSKFIFRATLNDDTSKGPFEIEMDRKALLDEAQKGGFFSYVAGTVYQVATHYRVRGLEIDNYRTDLPIKKGLSSSAALCVLVARAFNRICNPPAHLNSPRLLCIRFLATAPFNPSSSVEKALVPRETERLNLLPETKIPSGTSSRFSKMS